MDTPHFVLTSVDMKTFSDFETTNLKESDNLTCSGHERLTSATERHVCYCSQLSRYFCDLYIFLHETGHLLIWFEATAQTIILPDFNCSGCSDYLNSIKAIFECTHETVVQEGLKFLKPALNCAYAFMLHFRSTTFCTSGRSAALTSCGNTTYLPSITASSAFNLAQWILLSPQSKDASAFVGCHVEFPFPDSYELD